MAKGLLGGFRQVFRKIVGLASKGPSLVMSGILIVGVVKIASDCLSETVVLEPVTVKGAEHGPMLEMATQRIATHVAKIQRTGAREWRQHSFTDSDQSFDFQIPGSSLTVDTVVREIVELLPNRRRVVKVSITMGPKGKGRVAAVSISGGRSPKHETCEEEPDGLDKMFECVAIEAMSAIDPLFVASYHLSAEEDKCRRFEAPASTGPVEEMKHRLAELGKHCDFEKTRQAAGKIIFRDRKDDQPWVSYIYGKLHLARADALAKVDEEAQWYEYERAIRRFREFPRKEQPASVKAILMDVYIKNGEAMQKSTTSLKGRGKDQVIEYRLAKAAKIMKEAAAEFGSMDPWSSARASIVAAHGAQSYAWASFAVILGADLRAWVNSILAYNAEPQLSIERGRAAALDSRVQGAILYRQWVIEAGPRHAGEELSFDLDDRGRALLEKANEHFETASRQARHRDNFYVEWGHTLRALRRFDEAVTRYRRAGDIAPKDDEPLLNIAMTLLESARLDPTTRHLFEALRQTSNYLTWAEDGVRLANLVRRVHATLEAAADQGLIARFTSCHARHGRGPTADDKTRKAALKVCVDDVWESLSRQVVAEATRDRIVTQENTPVPRIDAPVVSASVGKPQLGELLLAILAGPGSVQIATSP
jgi:tetratricopeptide (TPR) repeat protein